MMNVNQMYNTSGERIGKLNPIVLITYNIFIIRAREHTAVRLSEFWLKHFHSAFFLVHYYGNWLTDHNALRIGVSVFNSLLTSIFPAVVSIKNASRNDINAVVFFTQPYKLITNKIIIIIPSLLRDIKNKFNKSTNAQPRILHRVV